MRRASGGRAPGEVGGELFQRAGDVADRVDGDLGVERRRLQPMSRWT
jgi:hypothetical protein